ncbi:MAG: hypothetical protein JNM47_12815 [Hyphomonadaceae bacterium]|nr:hypothetical protein [Hyphomonadaceae bacterium]
MSVTDISLWLVLIGTLLFCVGAHYFFEGIGRWYSLSLPPDWTQEGARLAAKRRRSQKRAAVFLSIGGCTMVVGAALFFGVPVDLIGR